MWLRNRWCVIAREPRDSGRRFTRALPAHRVERAILRTEGGRLTLLEDRCCDRFASLERSTFESKLRIFG